MVFRDADKEPQGVPRIVGRTLLGWLREIFIEDWSLKLLALAITLGLWYAVTGQRTPATVRLRGVQLNFRLPNNMEISNEPRREVEVTLTGSKYVIERLNARDLVAYVDISDFTPGDRAVQLNGRVTVGLPEGVHLDDIEPNNVPLRLEPRVERELDVEPRIEGKLPEGYQLLSATVTPNKVRVRGPASRLNALQKATTELISLDGRKESFTAPQMAIVMTDQKIDLIDTVVSVSVEIGETRIEKSFTNVSVQDSSGAQVRPETATVSVSGPRSVLDGLRAEQLRITLDTGTDGSITPRLVLPPDLEGRVELRWTKPTGFTIIR